MELKYNISNEEDFANLIKDKSILYIPIVSSINRKTDEYNLDSDGNINRTITTFLRCSTYSDLTIVLPSRHRVGSESLLEKFKEEAHENGCIVKFHYSPYFGKHAGDQRSNPYIIQNIINDVQSNIGTIDGFDYVIADSQYLIKTLVDDGYVNAQKVIFWNYLCSTETKGRSFTDNLKGITRQVIQSGVKVIVTSPDIAEYVCHNISNRYWSDIYYLPVFMDRTFNTFFYKSDQEIEKFIADCQMKNVPMIYLPFRLTDEAYQIDKVMNFIFNYVDQHDYVMNSGQIPITPVAVIYSDPNNSGMMEEVIFKDYPRFKELIDCHEIELKNVSTSRETFYTFIDSRYPVTIPYFEDIAFANHAAIWEFVDSNADVYLLDKFAHGNYPYKRPGDYNTFKPASRFLKE